MTKICPESTPKKLIPQCFLVYLKEKNNIYNISRSTRKIVDNNKMLYKTRTTRIRDIMFQFSLFL